MILDMLKESSILRVQEDKKKVPFEQIKEKALQMPKGENRFKKALQEKDISFICEVKKASPSKGIICENFNYLEIAKEYEKAGANAISVLTEPEYFLGSDSYLEDICNQVNIPVLRKDFTVDEYQIYQAKVLGADAVLLICSFFSTSKLNYYLSICKDLGISALVEAHNKDEIEMAVEAGAEIIGVNNRNLKNFEVDVNNSLNLRKFVPDSILFVAESGIKTKEDIVKVKCAGGNAVLVGETLMRSSDKCKTLNQLRSVIDGS